jgi:uncharacterized protein YndB with AHSA1/START domain
MSVVVARIDIAAAPQAVWDVAMDPATTRRWVSIVRDVGPWDDGPLVEGFRMDQRLHLRGVTFKVEWTLQEMDAPHFARWEGKGPARSRAVIEDRLTPSEDGTRFDYRNEFHTPFGPMGAIAARAVMGGIPKHEATASLQALKRLVEHPEGDERRVPA